MYEWIPIECRSNSMTFITTCIVLYLFSPLVYWKLHKDKSSYVYILFSLTFMNIYYVAEIVIMNKREILPSSREGEVIN